MEATAPTTAEAMVAAADVSASAEATMAEAGAPETVEAIIAEARAPEITKAVMMAARPSVEEAEMKATEASVAPLVQGPPLLQESAREAEELETWSLGKSVFLRRERDVWDQLERQRGLLAGANELLAAWSAEVEDLRLQLGSEASRVAEASRVEAQRLKEKVEASQAEALRWKEKAEACQVETRHWELKAKGEFHGFPLLV
ncbi:uncharacterized protein [Miscanthus floridulus]|uniref:uncharacterized protein n=1 Tax=Miscanthus floridulus TaxID=154761 RepID=UPI00345A5A99